MLLATAIALSGVAIVLLIISPQAGVLVTIAFKPIIDASWNETFFGFNCLDVVGVAVPTVILFRMLILRSGRPVRMQLIWLWAFYILANLLGFLITLSLGRPLRSAELFFRVLNGFVGFFMLQTYFTDREAFRKLLLAFMVAGLFPMFMGLYQAISGEVWRLRTGTGGLVRHVGLYHNAMNFRRYGYMVISAILLYCAYFSKRRILDHVLFTSYALICCVVIHKVYSKAAYFTLALWAVVWTVVHKKLGWLLALVLAAVALNVVTQDSVVKEILGVYSKETAALQGTGETDVVFSGRVKGWKVLLKEWEDLDVFYKVFGTGTSTGGGHNDYLRSLFSAGIVGLIAYLGLLAVIGFRLSRNVIRCQSPLNLMAVLIYCAWMVDTIGTVPGLYPFYQWYVWGFIGLAIHGVKDLDTDIEVGQRHSVALS